MILQLILLLSALALALWLVGNLLGFVVMLVVAVLVGFGAEAILPGNRRGSIFEAVACGLLGSFVGIHLIGHVGPELFGVPFVPALIGSLLVVLSVSVVRRSR